MRTNHCLLGSVIAVFGLINSAPASAESDPKSSVGRSLWVQYQCWQCHGYEGQGGAAPRVAESQYPFEAFVRFVRYPTNVMPAYTQELLSDEQLREILVFVQSIPAPPEIDDIPALRDSS